MRLLPFSQAGTGGSQTVTRTVTQNGHGLTVGALTPVRWNGSAYVKSAADTAANADVWGMAVATDANTFTLYQPGDYISGFTAITAGVNYLSTTAGVLTTTAPTTPGQVEKVLMLLDTTTSGYFEPQIGIPIEATPYAKQLLADTVAVTVADLGSFLIPSALDGLKLYSFEPMVFTVPATSVVTVGIKNNAGSAMLSTNATIAVGKRSSTETGGTVAVINNANATVAKGDKLVPNGVAVDSGAGGLGLSCFLGFSA